MNACTTQPRFASALLKPALAAPPGIRVASGVDPAQRFSIHRNNVLITLSQALADMFPVTQALVGKDFFHAMACDRVRADPPCSPIINDYGAGFATFITGFAPAADLTYLADVARLEYLRVQAYHAADAEPLGLTAYQTLLATPEHITVTRISLHPSCAWLRSRHAVHSIWSAHQGLDDMSAANLDAIDLDAAECTLVLRPDAQVLVHLLPSRATTWFDRLRDGVPLAAVVGRHADFERLLTLLIQHRMVVAMRASPQCVQ